jgi:phosphatidylglycerophosphatase A
MGSGLSPTAPGTIGTLAGLVFAVPIVALPFWAGALVVTGAFLIGVYLCGETSRRLGLHDHGGIVWDEFVGIWLVLLFVPFEPLWWLAAFSLFRLFDILKPWPIGWLDRRLGGGLGIMIDDVLAAIYAVILLAGAQLWVN